jgi:regulation of enolase protein 1 (concanavalin A-like superfamily)
MITNIQKCLGRILKGFALSVSTTIILTLILSNGCKKESPSQAPVEPTGSTFLKTFGGSNFDYGRSVRQTSDGGFVVAGYTGSFGGNSDFYLIRTDPKGNLLWQKALDGGNGDYGYCVQQTSDGGFIIAGFTYYLAAGDFDVLLIKTDANGNPLWQKIIGGSNLDYGYSIQQTTDGGYIVAGYSYSFGAGISDVYLIKIDASGNLLWQKTFGGSEADEGYSVQQTSDGGFIIVGHTFSFSTVGQYVYLIRTDASGNQLWQKTFGGSDINTGNSVRQTSDGGFIIAGFTNSFGAGSGDVYLIRTDASGNQLWQKTFGGSNYDYGNSVQQTSDGGFIVTGKTSSLGAGLTDVYLIKTDANGNQLWQKTFGGSNEDDGYAVQQTSDGGFIIAGTTGSYGAGSYDVLLIKTDANGTLTGGQ